MSSLKKWLSGEWHTNHSTDMDMFYKFVNNYIADHGHSLNERALLQLISEQAKCGYASELMKLISEKIRLMSDIIDYAKATGR
jgi:hypothetical protein